MNIVYFEKCLFHDDDDLIKKSIEYGHTQIISIFLSSEMDGRGEPLIEVR